MCSTSNEAHELKTVSNGDDKVSQKDTATFSYDGLPREKDSEDTNSSPDLGHSIGDATSHVTVDDTIGLVMSESASVCRICQEGPDTSGENLGSCQCLCKGNLARVHRSCLVEWVEYRGSIRCEICGGTFSDIPAPPRGRLGVNQQDALDALRHQISRYQPLSRRKRTAIGGVIVFLLLVTGVTAVITFGANRQFEDTNSDPWASEGDLDRAHIVFSICVALLFFCVTLTVGLLLLWGVLEYYMYSRRQRIMRRAAERILEEALAQRPETSRNQTEL